MSHAIIQPLQKTLVLGLGGTGKKMLIQLKRRLLEAGFADTAMQPDLRLLCLDFDPAEEATDAHFNGTDEVRLSPDESCWLDGALIHNRLCNMHQEHNQAFFRDWYPDREGTIIQMGAHRAGAAQWRPLGRVGYFEHADRIQVVLRRALNRLLEIKLGSISAERTKGVAVYIACSLGGGTGAGIFLDVAYFMRTLPVDLMQIGLFLLPGIYAEYDISGRLFANSYASLKELAVFANQSREFSTRYPNGRRITVPERGHSPFDAIYLYDNLIQADQVTSNPQLMAALMAESVYFDLVETRVGEMDKSATTNTGSQSGVRDNSLVAQQSVFATAGTLTLLMPSRRQVIDYLGNIYARDFLGKAIEYTKRGKATDAGAETALEPYAAEEFPFLEKIIDAKLGEALESVRKWPQDYQNNAAIEMATELVKLRHSKDLALENIDTWLADLVRPQAKGEFRFAPLNLPDMDANRDDSLANHIESLKEMVGNEVAKILAEQGEEGEARAEDMRLYLVSKAESLRSSVRGLITRLESHVKAGGGPYEKLKEDLLDLYGSAPWKGPMEQVSMAHWCRRFMDRVKRSYDKYASQIRVKMLMAAALDSVCGSLVTDGAMLRSVLVAGESINQTAEKGIREIRDKLKVKTSLVLRSLADEGFWKRFAERAGGAWSRQGALMGFLLFLRSQTGEDTAGGLTTKRIVELALSFGRQKVAKLMEEKGSELLDLHEYVDLRLRERELARARHDYQLKDVLLNSNQSRRAYAAAPTYSPRSSKDLGGINYKALEGDVGNVLSATPAEVDTYDAYRRLEDNEPGKIVVRHLSLNHPATNLRGIEDYYYAYARYGANRKLFHVDVNYADFPDVIEGSQQIKVVTCGNPGCFEDITDLPRTTIVCPHCGRPIKSRCGNPDCPENELHTYDEMNKPLDANGNKPDPDKYCPVCGNYARTYWWRCDRHNVDISTESDYCIHCLEEYNQDREKTDRELGGKPRLRFEEVSKREGVQPHRLCPGCVQDCLPNPFPIKFLDVYDEVPDNQVDRAWEVYSQETRNGYCSQCGARLLPFCPYHETQKRPHFVQRFKPQDHCHETTGESGGAQAGHGAGQGLFYCTTEQEHAQKEIYECSYCHLPLKKDAKYCPRCKRREMPNGPTYDPKLGKESPRLIQTLEQKLENQRWIWFGINDEDLQRLRANLSKQEGTATQDEAGDEGGSGAEAGTGAEMTPETIMNQAMEQEDHASQPR
ncbi:hypothetical protein AAU61_13735 [Desulfocarbo indianensis]|nr:hypothetical protein AAU61_13735 [Desulfocarbo indianensis]